MQLAAASPPPVKGVSPRMTSNATAHCEGVASSCVLFEGCIQLRLAKQTTRQNPDADALDVHVVMADLANA